MTELNYAGIDTPTLEDLLADVERMRNKLLAALTARQRKAAATQIFVGETDDWSLYRRNGKPKAALSPRGVSVVQAMVLAGIPDAEIFKRTGISEKGVAKHRIKLMPGRKPK